MVTSGIVPPSSAKRMPTTSESGEHPGVKPEPSIVTLVTPPARLRHPLAALDHSTLKRAPGRINHPDGVSTAIEVPLHPAPRLARP